MKRIVFVVAAALSVCAMSAVCAPASGLASLSAALAGIRENCATQAHDANFAFNTAQYKQTLDAQLAQQQAETDAQVYGIGHGRNETRDYLLSRMQENVQADGAKTQQISDKAASDKQLVQACVASAEQQGKALYSDFKRNHKREASAAESLMTAWLTNVDEITFDRPRGSDATDAAWKTAKAHAELSSL
jgi:hypothetical protein